MLFRPCKRSCACLPRLLLSTGGVRVMSDEGIEKTMYLQWVNCNHLMVILDKSWNHVTWYCLESFFKVLDHRLLVLWIWLVKVYHTWLLQRFMDQLIVNGWMIISQVGKVVMSSCGVFTGKLSLILKVATFCLYWSIIRIIWNDFQLFWIVNIGSFGDETRLLEDVARLSESSWYNICALVLVYNFAYKRVII